MGLIKAAIGSVSSTLADTWKDYFVCDALDNNTLMVKGNKKGTSLFGDNDVISNGSGVVVNDGQCALIVAEGKILEVANEPGNYTYDTGLTPSIFDGGFAGIKDTFKEMLERFTFGGAAAKNQRVYFINTKEIMGNLYGTANPIPFRVIDKNIGLDVDIAIRCNGEYSFRIVNPLLFYQSIAGNQTSSFTKDDLASQMKSELMTAMMPAMAKISEAGVRYSEIPAHTNELVDALNNELNEKWNNLRGIKIVSFGVNSVSASKEDEDMIKELQKAATLKDPSMLAANLAAAQADAMRDAANNANGALNGFVGMNAFAGGVGDTIQAAMSQAEKQEKRFCPYCGKEVKADAKFCSYCGKEL